MHVGIDASRAAYEDRSGTENYTLRLIESITKVDKKNKYTFYFNKLPQYFHITQANVSTRYIPLTYFWTQARLALEGILRPPDILFVPAHTIPVIRRPSMKTIVTVHDLGAEFLEAYHKFPQKLYLNWSTEYVAKHASHIIAVSESTKKDLTTTLKVPAKRISVVHEGVDHKFFAKKNDKEIKEIRLKYGLKDKYFLYVGTIQPRKNLKALIESFALMGEKDVDLVLAGKPGWLYDEIYATPKKLKIENKVKFLGYVPTEDLPALYSGCTGFVLPSLYEGFGLPILEAMACGAAVIVSKSSSLPEVSGGHALSVNPHDVRDISYNLRKILKDRDLRWKISAAGAEWSRNFSWEKTARETIKVFEKVYERE